MAKQNNLRFESREIAVILSLFIFVSLLMFTVGIVVGKGLAQAKFQGTHSIAVNDSRDLSSETSHPEKPKPPSGTIVSSNPPVPVPIPVLVPVTAPVPSPTDTSDEPLELKPKKTSSLDVHQDIELDAFTNESQSLLKDPKLSDLFETDKAAPSAVAPKKVPSTKKETLADVDIERDYTQENLSPRKVASVSKELPPSFASGPFSVQVASYSDELQAKERVETLKNLGFPHAYFSIIELGDNKETWYRVWLGYYPTPAAAKASGNALQARGEVKNYLVRKSESPRTKN